MPTKREREIEQERVVAELSKNVKSLQEKVDILLEHFDLVDNVIKEE